MWGVLELHGRLGYNELSCFHAIPLQSELRRVIARDNQGGCQDAGISD